MSDFETVYLEKLKAAGIWRAQAPISYFPKSQQKPVVRNNGRPKNDMQKLSKDCLDQIESGPKNRNEIAANIGIDKRVVSRVIEGLVKRGFVENLNKKRCEPGIFAIAANYSGKIK
ncbi:MAG: hypothetical protein U5K75_12020 [Ahrensia sp.]|nr:hypothetical protein [Ahrensia sp.]